MARINSTDLFVNFGVQAATPVTSDEVRFTGTMGEVFYILLESTGGTYSIEAYLFDRWIEVASGALVADALAITDVEFNFPKARLKVTPTNAGTLSASAHGYPSAYTLYK